MQDALLPLFPLQVVLFPRTHLPLHIFEERYKEMINEVLTNRQEFGVVQAGEKGIVNTGCTATIERVVHRYPDGRMDILAMGQRRFEILMLNEEKSYLRGSVQFFDDDEEKPAPHELQMKALAGFTELKNLEEVQVLGEPNVEDPHLSFKLAQLVPDLNFRQLLLSNRSETDRMQQLADFFPPYIIKQRRIAHIKQVAPRNGHAPIPLEDTQNG
jgi:Lon protease-like protein